MANKKKKKKSASRQRNGYRDELTQNVEATGGGGGGGGGEATGGYGGGGGGEATGGYGGGGGGEATGGYGGESSTVLKHFYNDLKRYEMRIRFSPRCYTVLNNIIYISILIACASVSVEEAIRVSNSSEAAPKSVLVIITYSFLNILLLVTVRIRIMYGALHEDRLLKTVADNLLMVKVKESYKSKDLDITSLLVDQNSNLSEAELKAILKLTLEIFKSGQIVADNIELIHKANVESGWISWLFELYELGKGTEYYDHVTDQTRDRVVGQKNESGINIRKEIKSGYRLANYAEFQARSLATFEELLEEEHNHHSKDQFGEDFYFNGALILCIVHEYMLQRYVLSDFGQTFWNKQQYKESHPTLLTIENIVEFLKIHQATKTKEDGFSIVLGCSRKLCHLSLISFLIFAFFLWRVKCDI